MPFPRFSVLRSIDLPCSVEELYDFHQDPGNMRNIMPAGSWPRLLKIEGAASIAEEGAEFIVHLRLALFLPAFRWKTRWVTADRPARLVDESLESPFAHFLHEHRFRPLPEGGSRLTDHIMYALPLPWLTWPVSLTAVYWMLDSTLKARQERTLAYFSDSE
jgi:ligand-binding SRPBCC domain-containing protein